MSGYAKLTSNTDRIFFSIIGFILQKHKCILNDINLRNGYINIIGNTKQNELDCHEYIENFLNTYRWG